jgi:hypothetical protein
MNDWPPKPGCTDMTSTISHCSTNGSTAVQGVGGETTTPNPRPNSAAILRASDGIGNGFDVHRDEVSARLGELREIRRRVGGHQVTVETQASVGTERCDNRDTERDVRHEVTVHDVEVEKIGAPLDGRHLFRQTAEVRRQQRRGDLDVHHEIESTDPSGRDGPHRSAIEHGDEHPVGSSEVGSHQPPLSKCATR